MIVSRCSAASLTLTRRAWASTSGTLRRSRWVSPMIAFIGVRISWLMLARKTLLARLAASEASRAASSSTERSDSTRLASSSWRVRSATRSSSWSR